MFVMLTVTEQLLNVEVGPGAFDAMQMNEVSANVEAPSAGLGRRVRPTLLNHVILLSSLLRHSV